MRYVIGLELGLPDTAVTDLVYELNGLIVNYLRLDDSTELIVETDDGNKEYDADVLDSASIVLYWFAK